MRTFIPPVATYGARWFGGFFPDLLWRVDTNERVAYLTFDDGPTRALTSRLIDLLSRYEAQATFFLIGGHAENHPGLVRALAEAGHTLGNHSYTHPHPWQTPAAQMRAELDRTTKRLRELTRHPIRYMRPPYGEVTGGLRTWCAERQCRCVMWDVMPGDYLQAASTTKIERFVLRHVRPGSIIVLHDNPIVEDVTPAALKTILRTLSSNGWRFEAL